MRALEVWLAGRLVGTISETRRGARFVYSEEVYEESPGMPVLSLCLPAKRRPFGESRTRNWFEGLLPEGGRRDRACRRLGLDSLDWVGLLSEIGWECAGAVQVFPEGGAAAHSGSYEPVAYADLAALLSDASLGDPLESSGSFRMSLGGFQDKLCVRMPTLPKNAAHVPAEGACLTLGDAASTHILKPEPSRYPGLAESEAWAMTAAARAARCARVALLGLEGCPTTLVVERYDREIGPHGAVTRLHQEDACQALGLPVSAKYANEVAPKGDDPTYAAIASLIDRYAIDIEGEKVELLRQLAVNMALGNWDAHAKNMSFLYRESGLPTVAPLYDVVPIAETEPRTTLLSMRVADSLDPASVDGAALLREAASWGLTGNVARNVIEDCLGALREGLDAAASLYPSAAGRHEATTLMRMERLYRMG